MTTLLLRLALFTATLTAIGTAAAAAVMHQAAAAAVQGVDRPDGPERGDVPGWVMITLMSAVLVAALLAIAGPALEGLFRSAMDQVSPGR